MTQSNPTHCPKCNSEHIYPDRDLWICPECTHEWLPLQNASQPNESDEDETIKDSNGNVLQDGDSVVVIKDLKIKGASSTLKSGTKVRNIRLLLNASDGHNLACKIEGIGAINLKSEFVKKS